MLMHKNTKTYIIDLGVEKMFGEIGFFTGRPRTVTAKSRTFSELVYLEKSKLIIFVPLFIFVFIFCNSLSIDYIKI